MIYIDGRFWNINEGDELIIQRDYGEEFSPPHHKIRLLVKSGKDKRVRLDMRGLPEVHIITERWPRNEQKNL